MSRKTIDDLKLELDGTLSYDPKRAKVREDYAEHGGHEYTVLMDMPATVEYAVKVRAPSREDAAKIAREADPDDPRIIDEWADHPIDVDDVRMGHVKRVTGGPEGDD